MTLLSDFHGRVFQVVGLRPIHLWDCGFESSCKHGYWNLMSVQTSINGCVCVCVSNCVWYIKPQQWGALSPRWAEAPQKTKDPSPGHVFPMLRMSTATYTLPEMSSWRAQGQLELYIWYLSLQLRLIHIRVQPSWMWRHVLQFGK